MLVLKIDFLVIKREGVVSNIALGSNIIAGAQNEFGGIKNK